MRRVFILNKLDYLANTYPPTKSKYPDGSDIEIFKFKSLLKISKLSTNNEDKEHVTNFFWKNPKEFKTKMINNKKDLSNYKFSIDYKSDLTLVKKISEKIKAKKTELVKLQELYSKPEEIPKELRVQVVRKIKTKRKELNELKRIYSEPESIFKSKKIQKWAGFQVVKVFLGMPIIPGK